MLFCGLAEGDNVLGYGFCIMCSGEYHNASVVLDIPLMQSWSNGDCHIGMKHCA